MLPRLIGAAAVAVLSVAGLALAGPADAAANRGCSGTACVDVVPTNPDVFLPQGGTGTIDYDVTVSSGQANLQFSATDSAGLSPVAGTATFDGAALPSAAVTITGQSISIDLSSVNPVAAGQSHQVGFDVTMSPTAQGNQTSVATVRFDDTLGGPPATSASADQLVELAKPDFQIQASDPGPARVTAGNLVNVSFNAFGPAVPPANFVITVPAGFAFVQADNNGTALHCVRTASTVTCDGADLSKIVLLGIQLRADKADQVGRVGTVTVQVVPVGVPDATPADNTASTRVQVTGTVALKLGFSSPYGLVAQAPKAALATLPVDKPTTITMTVTNKGPNAASGVTARFSLQTNTPTDFAVSFGPGLAGNPPAANHPAYGDWQIGALAVGQTATTTVTITPKKVGDTAFLTLFMSSNEVNTLQCPDAACNASGAVDIAVAQSVAAPVAVPAASGSNSELANTGSPVRAPLLAGTAALLAGSMLLVAGRRRRSARHIR